MVLLADLPTMSALRILLRLYSLDTSSLDFLRHLYCLIRHGEREQYSPSPQASSFRDRSWLGSMKCSLQPFVQLRNGLCRPSMSFPPTTGFLDNGYTSYKPSAVTMRPYHPHASHLDVIIPLWNSTKVSLTTTNKHPNLEGSVEVSHRLTRMPRSTMQCG